jgi:cobalt-precorrin 5A hydrolase/precorrin-3B C17-methyltransferase
MSAGTTRDSVQGEIALVLLSASALPTARRIAAAIPEARPHGLARRVADCDVAFEDVGAHLSGLFASGVPIVGLCAAGILVRALGPGLADKRVEPPVIAIAEDGSAVVPLLGGHRGANDLARRLGAILGTAPAITTAGDVRFGLALDEPPPGYRLINPEHVKEFAAALLAGGRVRIEGAAPWLEASALPIDPAGALSIAVTPYGEPGYGEPGSATRLVYRPAQLALGVGCERGAEASEVLELIDATLAEAQLARDAVAVLVSLDLKMDEPAIHAAAVALDVPVRFFDAATLEAETPRLANPSDLVFREVGCHGVAEGAALASVGRAGRLLVPKKVSRRATCAIAIATTPLDPARIGMARGKLAVVGIGPGAAEWLTPEAARLIDEASDLVGYRLYLDLLGARGNGKVLHAFDLGDEVKRVERALELAQRGRSVALVSSGDPGIYAMASLVFERLEEGAPARRRIEIRVAPGISALQAAAARIGAPLGHDFCAISLSDLLTPWPAIERRLEAAAQGDFVVTLYNPVSTRRAHQLGRAREILLAHRPPATPVVLARNLGRAGENVRALTLAELDPAEVDMLTLVLVGSSATRLIARGDGGVWVYTPRGYGAALEPAKKEAG